MVGRGLQDVTSSAPQLKHQSLFDILALPEKKLYFKVVTSH
jgi:hypothetical protein